MVDRKELEQLLGTKFTDEQWAEALKAISDAQDKMWDEDHPMDE